MKTQLTLEATQRHGEISEGEDFLSHTVREVFRHSLVQQQNRRQHDEHHDSVMIDEDRVSLCEKAGKDCVGEPDLFFSAFGGKR